MELCSKSRAEWPETSIYRYSEEFKSELSQVAKEGARTLSFEFIVTEEGGLVKGLEAEVSQFVSTHGIKVQA
jgi:hypothetical protein